LNKITVSPDRQNSSYKVTILRTGKKIPYSYDKLSKSDAAAKASELSIGCDGKYQIIANEEILSAIRFGGIFGDNG
tara:strand:+ start:236 stop:463 length:228 start_codon:yes stop_codon:yes gene_type:complete